MTHLAAYALGILSTLVLLRLHARRTQRPARPFRRSRIAVRQDDAQRLWEDVERGLRALRQLDQVRAARVPRPARMSPDLVDEINAILDQDGDAA